MPANKEKHQKVGFLGLLCAQQAFALRSISNLHYIEKEGWAIARRLVTSETRHKEALKKVKDDHVAEMGQLKEEMDRLKEEIKKLEPFESRARVLEEEMTKLIAELRVFEQKSMDAH